MENAINSLSVVNLVHSPENQIYESFGCDLSLDEINWLKKNHVIEIFGAARMTDELKNYSNSDEKCSLSDFIIAVLFFKKLNNKIKELKMQNADLEVRLKKYTNGENHKRYYEKNKEKIKETGATYLEKLKNENPAKIKEYSHRAYLNQKKKKEQLLADQLKESQRVVVS